MALSQHLRSMQRSCRYRTIALSLPYPVVVIINLMLGISRHVIFGTTLWLLAASLILQITDSIILLLAVFYGISYRDWIPEPRQSCFHFAIQI